MCEKWLSTEKSGGEPLSLRGDKRYNKIESLGAAIPLLGVPAAAGNENLQDGDWSNVYE